jgi:hypothetical protein
VQSIATSCNKCSYSIRHVLVQNCMQMGKRWLVIQNSYVLVWPLSLAQVLPHPQLSFPSKTLFFEFIWIFSSRNHLKLNISHILNPNITKWIPLNRAHQKISNYTKGTFQFLQFSVKKPFNIQELLRHNSKHHGTKPMYPSSSRAFQRH